MAYSLVLAAGAAAAQTAPDAGRVQEQLRTPAPPPKPLAAPVQVQIPEPDQKADTPPFQVNGFRLQGVTVFPESRLLGLIAGDAGRPLTLAQVQALAERLTKFYADQGYVVARALIPAQDVRDGMVLIQVLEGRYGLLDIRNATEVPESRIRALLGDVREGGLIHGPRLERGVLLLSEYAGLQARATLEPGAETGTANLVLDIVETRAREYDASVDNAGSRYTGRHRLSVGATWNSPADRGDRLVARAVTSGRELLSLRVAYELPVGPPGLRAGAFLSQTQYQLGGAFRNLDASGTALSAGLSASYPFLRSSGRNLRGQASAESRRLEDRIGAFGSVNQKGALVLQWGLTGDRRDDLLAGGLTAFSAIATHGRLDLESATLAATDAGSARTQGGYAKLALGLTRVQSLTPALRFTAGYSGQLAAKNLDSSEKMSIGGLSGVRAYPTGEAAGDDVHLLQLELRHEGGALLGGQLSPYLFLDRGRSRLNHDAWAGLATKNLRYLGGWGFGAEWSLPGKAFLRGWFARKTGAEPALAEPDTKTRFWAQAGVAF